ncbi:hypothetical protein F8280_16755 [Micromonospora noduli]|uniref:Uncharacterized protein n=1 Tax=Micromonospora noduli TaxID=709876 RepID=A0A328NFT6_9ACTN|nr:hypothetical protein [Micromonospora noduli]KAB1923154.1 hypothetical protein F8280_16755 [Micromonospora noduli]RAO05543.1 hypothetical protein LAH08_01002 [Micromonospora noduli]
MQTESVIVETAIPLAEAAAILNVALAGHKATIEPLTASNNPLDQLGHQPDVALLASRKGAMGAWGVRVYLTDYGDRREIHLEALGDGGFSRAFHGIKNTFSLSKSLAKAQALAANVVNSDATAVVR